MHAIRVDAFGSPEALRLVELPLPKPQEGEMLARHSAIGVNFVDTQHRAGTPYSDGLRMRLGVKAPTPNAIANCSRIWRRWAGGTLICWAAMIFTVPATRSLSAARCAWKNRAPLH
jgi:hypothetical protein